MLSGAGLTLQNVVKANIYLTNLSQDFAAVNEVGVPSLADRVIPTESGLRSAGVEGAHAGPQTGSDVHWSEGAAVAGIRDRCGDGVHRI